MRALNFSQVAFKVINLCKTEEVSEEMAIIPIDLHSAVPQFPANHCFPDTHFGMFKNYFLPKFVSMFVLKLSER